MVPGRRSEGRGMSREETSHELSPHETPVPEPGLDPILRQQLLERLRSLPYPAYCHLVRQLLRRGGYSSIQSLGIGAKRKTVGHGGVDMLAVAHTGVATILTAIQAKQYKGTVPRRFIDELRGAMPRFGAEQGLIVVTGSFSRTARAVAEDPKLAPVRLVGGWELVELLVEQRLGLQRARRGQEVGWSFDAGYFATLEEQAGKWLEAARAKGHKQRPGANPAATAGRWP